LTGVGKITPKDKIVPSNKIRFKNIKNSPDF
jgi:hypothetical protein